MSNAWDPFPLPTQGDDTDVILFEWVGRLTCQWVHIEFDLGILYSGFAGRFRHAETVRNYGNGKTFRERLTGLRQMADTFFVVNSNQELEADFQKICSAAEGFADRRNEVAHAIVYPSVFSPSFVLDRTPDQQTRWALVPPHFDLKKFDATNVPKYAYTSKELMVLVSRLGTLREQIDAFLIKLSPSGRVW